MLPSSGDEVRSLEHEYSAPWACAQRKEAFQAGVDVPIAPDCSVSLKRRSRLTGTSSHYTSLVACSKRWQHYDHCAAFLPKKELPQWLRMTSLTAIIKSWSKSWCPAVVHQFFKCCISEAECASGSSAEPGLDETSLKWILWGKASASFSPCIFSLTPSTQTIAAFTSMCLP